jgi:hypothetical protein
MSRTVEKPLYVTVQLRLTGPWGTPEHVAAAVEWDMNENYQTDLQLSDPQVLAVTEERVQIVKK